jgi:hypothetical protein
MELAVTDKSRTKHRITGQTHTCTAAYAIDRGVTLLLRWSFDATLRRTELLHETFCDLVGATFSMSFSSSRIFFAEEGDVNILL